MTGKEALGLFSVSFLFLISCATASPTVSTTNIEDVKAQLLDIRTELSSTQVVPGTIVLIKADIPPQYRKENLVGNFEGIEFPFFPAHEEDDGVFEAVLGVPYERKPGPGKVKVSLKQGEVLKFLEVPLNIVEGNYPSEVLKVDGRRVNPKNRKDLLRIRKEQAEVAKVYQRVTQRKYWKGPFKFPIQSSITSPFGTRRTYNGELKNFHPGLDLKAPIGTRIFSAAPGIVVMAKNLFYTGNTVMIDHGFGIITLYAHMSRMKVKEGQSVNSHHFLGLSGKTGRVNGPHLHWQAVVHRVKINPLGLTQVID